MLVLLLVLRLLLWLWCPLWHRHAWRWRVSPRLSGLLLLHLQLPLLHFLQHLLRSLHCGLVRRDSRGLFRVCSTLVRNIVGGIVWGIGIGGIRRSYLRRRGCLVVSGRWLRARRVGSGLSDQHNPYQRAGVIRRSQQDVIEVRSVQQFRYYLPGGSRTEARYHAFTGGGWNFDIGRSVLADAAQNVTQG